MLSCFTGHVRVTKVLLAHDADVNLQNDEGITALMMSSYNGHAEIVELLIKYRADINTVTSIGKSALDFSTDKGHDEVSKLLVEYGGRERGNSWERTLSMRDPSREESVTSTFSNSQLEERLDRMEQIFKTSRNFQMEERMDRIEQILQTLLQNQVTSIATAAPAAKPTLQAAFKLLSPLAHDWHNIGIMLSLESHLLKDIERNYRMVKDCLREMLSLWLSNATPSPRWEELAQALEDADYQGIARKVRRVYEQT